MNWKQYEQEIYDELISLFPRAHILKDHNVRHANRVDPSSPRTNPPNTMAAFRKKATHRTDPTPSCSHCDVAVVVTKYPGQAFDLRRDQLSTVIQNSRTYGHRKFPHPRLKTTMRRVPVVAVGRPSAACPSRCGRVCASTATAASTGPPIAHVPAVVGLTTPDFSLSFSRYESPRMLIVVA